MTDALLRYLHVPWWVPFCVWFGGYSLTALYWVANGYTRELFGSPLPHMGRIHKVVFNFHTGLPVKNMKTSGDKRHLKRVAADSRRATPEGETVLWHKWPRWARALRNNFIIVAILLILSCMVVDPENTVRAVTLAILAVLALWVYALIRGLRRKRARKRPIARKPLTVTKKAKAIMEADDTTIGSTAKLEAEAAPQLEGVPATVLAGLLAGKMGCSTAEMLNRLTLDSDHGQVILPDGYAALIKGREEIQEIIEAHTVGQVKFDWKTTVTPRTLSWIPIPVYRLPDKVRFRDYLKEIEKLPAREFGVGVVAERSMYVASHNGDFPWWCRFAGPGTGKTTGFLVKAAQVCHKDPSADVYCFDTKQVSFRSLYGIPGVYIFDKPLTEMHLIWNQFYVLHKIMQQRYADVAAGKIRLADLNDIWMFIDEGNDLAACFKSYAKNMLGETGGPRIWGEAAAPLMRMGREARIFGEFMCQDLDGRMFAGETLKTAFNGFGAAGFLPGTFSRTVGGKAEECIEGPGKILMCRGKKREWVQGFYDDEEWLHEYALENRKERAA